MREIKFRGLTLKNQWIYGCYVTDYKDYHAIAKEDPDDSEQMLNMPVDPKSVGQYTGLKDCDGVEIYEKDKVEVKYFNGKNYKTHIETVEFSNGKFDLTWTINKLFKSYNERPCFHNHSNAFEVVGE